MMTSLRPGTVSPMRAAWWSGWSDPERFEVYNRWSLYVLLVFGPFFGLVVVTTEFADLAAWYIPVLVGGFLLQAGLAEIVLARAVDQYLGRRPRPVRLIVTLIATTVALLTVVAMALYALPWPVDPPEGTRIPGWLLLMPLLVLGAAVAPVVRPRTLVLLALPILVGVAAIQVDATGDPRAGVPFVIASTTIFVGITLSFRVAAWMIGVVWDLDRRREVDARLAVAEERLRFSRDLHDIFGRTLATVAVTSELAAELARRGDPRGAEKMLEVRQISQDALREVRAVVDGYRRADLPTELAGARDILQSAGVRVTVSGEREQVGDQAAEALAWVVREAVTNVVRHADARTAVITLEAGDGAASVEIVNDGVRPLAQARQGSGLHGLAERLATVGGRIDFGATDDGGFRIRAEVPDDGERATTAEQEESRR